jgi:hypothetical protein
MMWHGLDWSDSGYGPVAGSCEHGSELSGPLSYRESVEWLATVVFSRMTRLREVSTQLFSVFDDIREVLSFLTDIQSRNITCDFQWTAYELK